MLLMIIQSISSISVVPVLGKETTQMSSSLTSKLYTLSAMVSANTRGITNPVSYWTRSG